MFRSTAAQYGLWAGLATIALMVIAYVLDPRLMISPGVIWGSLLFYIYFMVRAVREVAQAWTGEGRVPFRLCLQPAFLVYLVASALYYAFYYLMFTVVDPGLADIQEAMVLEQLGNLEGLFGHDRVEEMRRVLEEEGFQVSLLSVLINFGQGLIGGFILSLIVTGLLRSRY